VGLHDLRYPYGVDVEPFTYSDFQPETRFFNTADSYAIYVRGDLWGQSKGRSGHYSRPLMEVWNGTDWSFQDEQDGMLAISQAPYIVYKASMEADSSSPTGYLLNIDPTALSALQGLGPYEQDRESWHTLFSGWGTSVVKSVNAGGVVEAVNHPKTLLRDHYTTAALLDQAEISFTELTGLGGHTGMPDPNYTKYTSHEPSEFHCYGGDPAGCHASAGPLFTNWTKSLRVGSEQMLVDYELLPVSRFIADPVLRSTVDAAVDAYLSEVRMQFDERSPCPVSCGDAWQGFAVCNETRKDKVCTCNECFEGRQCSSFNSPWKQSRTVKAHLNFGCDAGDKTLHMACVNGKDDSFSTTCGAALCPNAPPNPPMSLHETSSTPPSIKATRDREKGGDPPSNQDCQAGRILCETDDTGYQVQLRIDRWTFHHMRGPADHRQSASVTWKNRTASTSAGGGCTLSPAWVMEKAGSRGVRERG
jgi:hypothetical protein